MAKVGVMAQKMVKVPVHIASEIEKYCKDETEKRGQFYSVSRFFRDAGMEKLKKVKSERVERQD